MIRVQELLSAKIRKEKRHKTSFIVCGIPKTDRTPPKGRDAQDRDVHTKKYSVSDGDTPRKNVVLISMEIGAMALKTALFFVDSHHDAGYNVGLTDQ